MTIQADQPGRYEISTAVTEQWQGTQDNDAVKYALESARTLGNRYTVDAKWRWLHDDLSGLYDTNPDEGAACYSYLRGWIDGASLILNKVGLKMMGL